MAMVKAPNTEYTGVSAGVFFKDGEGCTDNPYILDWFREHGYTVEQESSGSNEVEEPDKTADPKKPTRRSKKAGE